MWRCSSLAAPTTVPPPAESGASGAPVEVEVVSSEEGLLALRAEWDELWRSSAGRYQDSHEFALLSWRHVVSADGAALCCLVIREDGRPAIVWPTAVQRRSGLRVVAPLGPGAADDVALLVRPGAEHLLARAWEALVAAARADVLQLPYLVDGSPLHRVALGSDRRVVGSSTDRLPVALLRHQPDWDTYRGKSSRKEAAYELRRLAKLGEVRQREVVGGRRDADAVAEVTALVDWVLDQRRRRGEVTGRYGSWLQHPGYREFLIASMRDTDPERPLARIFVLELDGRPVSVLTAGAGVVTAHPQVTAYDGELADYSPGLRPFEQCGRWAVAEGLDMHLGPGDEAYKTRLARGHEVATVSLTVALTRRARLAFGAREGVNRLRASRASGRD